MWLWEMTICLRYSHNCEIYSHNYKKSTNEKLQLQDSHSYDYDSLHLWDIVAITRNKVKNYEKWSHSYKIVTIMIKSHSWDIVAITVKSHLWDIVAITI